MKNYGSYQLPALPTLQIPDSPAMAEEVKPNGAAETKPPKWGEIGVPNAADAIQQTGKLLEAIGQLIRLYVVLTEAQTVVASVWVLHAHTFKTATFTPILHIQSPEPECGKSRLLEVLELVVPQPWKVVQPSLAVLKREIALKKCVLLFDESDGAFQGSPEVVGNLISIINSGFEKDGTSALCERKDGKWVAVDMPSYCPKAIAGLEALPASCATRSIPIHMRRKKKSEKVNPFRKKKAKEATSPLKEKLAQWAALPQIQALGEHEPEMPLALRDRQMDIAEHLVAIADYAGGGWPQKVRNALVELFTGHTAEEPSTSHELLEHLQRLFANLTAVSSAEMVSRLLENEEWPWKTIRKGDRPLDQNTLARMLSRYENGRGGKIHPQQVKVNKVNQRGYFMADFEDAWSRYCRPP
jgi:hypothetical protein